MALLQKLFHLTSFKSPLAAGIIPPVAAAFAIQAAFAAPSIAAQSDRFYDFSGAVTYVCCTALSLYLPHLRARLAASAAGTPIPPIPGLLSPFRPDAAVPGFNWRQVAYSAAVAVWAFRLGSYLFQRVLSEGKDSRFDKIKTSPSKFAVAFFGQAVWVSCCLMPVLAVNAVPARAFSAVPALAASEALGLAVWLGGFAFEVVADRQKNAWVQDRKAKLHDEQFITRGLWGRSQFPNYFGEITLWSGLAVAACGALFQKPVQLALGLSGVTGRLAAVGMSAISPLFTSFLLLCVSGVPLSERKYEKKFGDRKDYREWKENTPKVIPKLW